MVEENSEPSCGDGGNQVASLADGTGAIEKCEYWWIWKKMTLKWSVFVYFISSCLIVVTWLVELWFNYGKWFEWSIIQSLSTSCVLVCKKNTLVY